MELAKRLGATLTVIPRGNSLWTRPWLPVVLTIKCLLTGQRDVLFVQNPSLMLTTMAAALKGLRNYSLVQDLHSYFYELMENPRSTRDKLYRVLSRYCIRRADLTIVTNEYLKDLVHSLGGRPFVLQDPIPSNAKGTKIDLGPGAHVVFICSYSQDEPLREVAIAAAALGTGVTVHVTGCPPKGFDKSAWPPNMVSTGFLAEIDYWNLLASADVILTLTTRDHTLLCGAYEALAVGRPIVMSRTPALESYFAGAVMFSGTTGCELADAIRCVLSGSALQDSEVATKRATLQKDWERRFVALLDLIG